ncbi:MAG: hypothetical protein HYV78_00705, partial [Candidatus Wildermuthbacteria bacterium]|nr:hypothetical protein [Candidatus Wildermuthbacteria bacterium]
MLSFLFQIVPLETLPDAKTFTVSILAKTTQQQAPLANPPATPAVPTAPASGSALVAPSVPAAPPAPAQSSVPSSSGQTYFYFYDIFNKECRRTTATYANGTSCQGAVNAVWGKGNTGNDGQCFATPYLCGAAFASEATAGRILCDSSKTTQSSVSLSYWYQKGRNVSLFRNNALLSSNLMPGTDLQNFIDSNLQASTSYTYTLRNGTDPSASTMLDGISCATLSGSSAPSSSPQISPESAAPQPQKPYYFYAGGICRITNGTYASATACKGAVDQMWGAGNTGGRCFDAPLACQNAYQPAPAAGSIVCGNESTANSVKLYYWHINGQNVSLFREGVLISGGLSGGGDTRDIIDSGLQANTSYTYYLRNGSDISAIPLDKTVCSAKPATPTVIPPSLAGLPPSLADGSSFQSPAPSIPTSSVSSSGIQAQTPSFALTVTKDGAGTVASESPHQGISCGTTCSKEFPSKVGVQLVATPRANFRSWSGDDCISTVENTCLVFMDKAKTIKASFVPPDTQQSSGGVKYVSLTVKNLKLSEGTVTVRNAATQDIIATQSHYEAQYPLIPQGSKIIITLSSNVFQFGRCTEGYDSRQGSKCTLQMDRDRSVTADFSSFGDPEESLAVFHTLQVEKSENLIITSESPHQGISCGTTCSKEFP